MDYEHEISLVCAVEEEARMMRAGAFEADDPDFLHLQANAEWVQLQNRKARDDRTAEFDPDLW